MKKFAEENKHSALQHHQWRFLAPILLLGLSISACSAPALTPVNASMQGSPPPKSMTPANTKALRVIVKFKQTVPYRDAGFLQDISRKINAPIAYISSVSANTHIYHIAPQAGQSPAEIIQRLSGIPVVQYAEADTVALPQ